MDGGAPWPCSCWIRGGLRHCSCVNTTYVLEPVHCWLGGHTRGHQLHQNQTYRNPAWLLHRNLPNPMLHQNPSYPDRNPYSGTFLGTFSGTSSGNCTGSHRIWSGLKTGKQSFAIGNNEQTKIQWPKAKSPRLLTFMGALAAIFLVYQHMNLHLVRWPQPRRLTSRYCGRCCCGVAWASTASADAGAGGFMGWQVCVIPQKQILHLVTINYYK